MKNYTFAVLLACLAYPAQAQTYSYQTLEVNVSTHYTFKSLRLYPIRAKATFKQGTTVGKFTPLHEALAGKKIVIAEMEALPTQIRPNTRNFEENTPIAPPQNQTSRQDSRRRGRQGKRTETPQALQPNNIPQQQQQQIIFPNGINPVNNLQIENVSKDTIYIMAGEIIQGGKQDRVLAQDLVLPPASGKVDVSVFCVEQGRWKYNTADSTQNFSKHYGIASPNLRKKIEKDNNQQAVWSEVRRANNENNIQTETGAYTAQKQSPYLQKNTEEYLAYFREALAKETDMIGVLVATGDKVVGCDLFASPALFQSQMQTLLASYITEALTDGFAVSVEPKTVQQYLDNLLKDDASQKAFIEQKGKVFQHENKKLRISTF